jgi:hypothetical protein
VLTKSKFSKQFQPFTVIKKPSHFVSLPQNAKEFLGALPFLAGLKKCGTVLLLVPNTLLTIYHCLKPNTFETLFYDTPLQLFSKEYTSLREKLKTRTFHCLIELNIPPNLSLPYLTTAEKRICFYGSNRFPYYNILIKNNIRSLIEFLRIQEEDPQPLFHFSASGFKKVSKKIDKKQPLLFINGKNDIQWDGEKIVVGRDISPSVTEAYHILYLADAYYGKHDAFHEFAKMFNKRIIE